MSKLIGYENDLKRKKILHVQINLLSQCTSRCVSCRKYTWPKEELLFSTVEKVLRVLKEQVGLETVLFSGGDPILYKDLDKVIDLCGELGLKYSMITTLITKNKELVKKIARTAYRISVSIDGSTREYYKMIRGVDALNIVEENLEIVRSVRPEELQPVRISATIGKLNFRNVLGLYKLAKDHGCNINFYYLHTWDNLKMEDKDRNVFYYQMEMIAKDEMMHKKRISNASTLLVDSYNFETKPACKTCYLPMVSATIDANGDIYPCCKLLNDNGEYGYQRKFAYGNVRKRTEEEIMAEFENRLSGCYPVSGCDLEECRRRFGNVLEELEMVMNDERTPVFF